MSPSEYERGKKGFALEDTDSGLEYARGIRARFNEESSLKGEEHPQAPQLVILILGFSATFALLWNSNFFPFEMWQVILLCIAALLGTIWILRKIPNWLSGSVMAILLGGVAAYIGWTSGDIYWSVGSGVIVGGLMFRLYSNFD